MPKFYFFIRPIGLEFGHLTRHWLSRAERPLNRAVPAKVSTVERRINPCGISLASRFWLSTGRASVLRLAEARRPQNRRGGPDMHRNLREMTGEQLLLVSVLKGPKMHAKVERELDRRSSATRPRTRDRSGRLSRSNVPQLVA